MGKGVKHAVYTCPVCGMRVTSIMQHCNNASTKNVEHVALLQQQYVRANALFDNMDYSGGREITPAEMVEQWGLYMSTRAVDEIWESNRTVEEFNNRQLMRCGRIHKQKTALNPHIDVPGQVPMNVSSYVDANGEWVPTALPAFKPDPPPGKPSRERTFVCPVCGERVQRITVHVANHNDAAHAAFVESQRALAVKLFTTTEALHARELVDHGVIMPHDFVKRAWIEAFGAQAVADRAQQLRTKHIAATLKNAHIRYGEARRKQVVEQLIAAEKWNRGLSTWTRQFFVEVANERFTAAELEEMRTKYRKGDG